MNDLQSGLITGLTFFFICLFPFFTIAQDFEFEQAKIIHTAQDRVDFLTLSPDGQYFSFYESNRKGLQVHYADGRFYKSLFPARKSATLNPVKHRWSFDSKSIAIKSSRTYWDKNSKFAKTEKGVRTTMRTIEIIDVETGRATNALTEKRRVGFPEWQYENGKKRVIAIDRNKVSKTIGSRAFKTDIPDDLIAAQQKNKILMYEYKSPSQGHLIHKYENNKVSLVTSDTYLPGILSPDGTKMAYLSVKQKLMVMDLNTGEKTLIGKGERYNWSPDGRYLLFEVNKDNGGNVIKSELFILDEQGGNIQQLTSTPKLHETRAKWSPDGQSIYFMAHNTNHIYRLDLKKVEKEPDPTDTPHLFSIYPNPATQQIVVELGQQTPATSLHIMDMNGRSVKSIPLNQELEKEINITALAAGTYLVSLKHDSRVIGTKRFIKIRM